MESSTTRARPQVAQEVLLRCAPGHADVDDHPGGGAAHGGERPRHRHRCGRLRAAIELAERGVEVLCVGKRRRDDPHTVLASGGINAALGTMDPEDSWQQHAADTLREGYWLSNPASVEILAREAPRAIDDLVRWGARFAREEDGRLTQRFFGAHRHRRTCFAGDYTGREIQRVLV